MDIYKSISNKSTKVLLILIAGTLGFISGCGGAGNGGGGGGPGGNNGGGATMYDYVCENGTPKEGKSQTENDNKCQACEPGYTLASEQCTQEPTYPYVCENGTRQDGLSLTENENRCRSCNARYMLDNGRCEPIPYVCENGTPASGQSLTENENKCQACDAGYLLDGETCRVGHNYVCENGTRQDGLSLTENENKCRSCNAGYSLNTDTMSCALAERAGMGTEASPYVLLNYAHLKTMVSGLDKHYKLGAAIDATASWGEGDSGCDPYTGNGALPTGETPCTGWVPVGNNTTSFTGSLDGNGHTIMNLYVNTSGSYGGLFGLTGGSAQIKNVGLMGIYVNVSPSGNDSAYGGGLVGDNLGSIVSSYATGEVTASSSGTGTTYGTTYGGGLVGENRGSIVSSYATGEVTASSSGTGSAFGGGLVGRNPGSIVSSYATGEVTASSSGTGSVYGGGLVGYSINPIMNSYATGEVTTFTSGNSIGGGLVGWSEDSISNSYATGDVGSSGASNSFGGGLVGNNSGSGDIANCYATGGLGCVTGQTCMNPTFGGLLWRISGATVSGVNYFVYNGAGTADDDGVGGTGTCANTVCKQATGTTPALRLTWMRDTFHESTAFTTDTASSPAYTAWDTAAWASLDTSGSFPKLKYVEVEAYCSDSSHTTKTACEADGDAWLFEGAECEAIASNTAAQEGGPTPDCGDLITGQ